MEIKFTFFHHRSFQNKNIDMKWLLLRSESEQELVISRRRVDFSIKIFSSRDSASFTFHTVGNIRMHEIFFVVQLFSSSI